MEKATFRTLLLGLLLTSASVFSQGGSDGFTGQVLYHNNYPMSGTDAYLRTSNGTIIDTAVTDNDGNYEFDNLAPGNYTVTFSTQQPAGGVELSDAFLVLMRVMNLITFTPIQAIAADVNGSGTITFADYIMILISYLNQGNPFPIGPWVFETTSVTIPTASRDGFVSRQGSSSGDVNGNLQPDPKSNPVFLVQPLLNISKGSSDPFEFNLSGGQNLQIAGMHLIIRIPDGIEVLSVESAIKDANINISDGKIKVTWMDQTRQRQGFDINENSNILVITSRAKHLSREGNQYTFSLGDESHFINTDGELLSGVSLILPTINLKLQEELTYTAYPNPFINSTTIEYQIPQDGQVTISLYDLSGRLVFETENSSIPAGSQQVKIDGSSLLPGIYHYSIRYSGNGSSINSGTIIKSK